MYMYVTVWTGICVGYMCVGRTAACMDMYKGRGPLGHNPKVYGVHRFATPYDFRVLTRFSAAFPNILRK